MSDVPRLIKRLPRGQPLEPATPAVELHIPYPDPLHPFIIEADHANNLTRYSVQLRSILKEARRNKQAFVVLKCGTDDGTNLSVFEWVFRELPKRTADPGGDTCDAPTLCAACNVLFLYKCLPAAFAGFSTKVVAGSSAGSIASEIGPPSRAEPARCWQVERMVEGTTERAGQLMTIALVLSDKTLFEAELATMIWRAERESLKTSVGRVADLQGKIASSWLVAFSTWD